MSKPIPIAVVGSGYVGLVAAVCFAEMGHPVICVDNDERKVAALQGGDSLIHEHYLPELLAKYRNTRVRFTTDLAEAARESAAIFIAVGTPQSENGDADLSYVEAVACEIARSLDSYKVIVEKSTVPVYTNEWISRALERNGVERHLFDVVSNPEFLREGTAVADFLHPDRIVVGTDSEQAGAILRDIYAPLTSGEYYTRDGGIPGSCTVSEPPPLLMTSTKSAEIIKHASNAFLALIVRSAGERSVDVAQDCAGSLAIGTDDDAIRVQEVSDGGTLAEELGVRDDVKEMALDAITLQRAADPLIGIDRYGALLDDDLIGGQRTGDLAGDCLHVGEIGIAGLALRCTDRDEDRVGLPCGLGKVGGETDARIAILSEQLREVMLMD